MTDLVTYENAPEFRKVYSMMIGHSEECISETVTDMSDLFRKICASFNIPPTEILKKIDVETFDYHIKAILESKNCNCLKKS